MALDLGSPAQLADTPGWTALGLDELLGTEGLSLEEDARARLQSACDHAVKHLSRVLVARLVQHHLAFAVQRKVDRRAGREAKRVANLFRDGDLAFDGEGGGHGGYSLGRLLERCYRILIR